MKNRRIIPNAALMGEVKRLLSEGCEVTLRAKGRSMMPYIRDDRDNIIVKQFPPEQLSIGDAVLAELPNGHYVMHRIIGIENGIVTLKGDGNLRGTERCAISSVLGMLTHVERNGRRIDCNTKAERLKASAGKHCYRAYLLVRATGGKILRSLGLRPRKENC